MCFPQMPVHQAHNSVSASHEETHSNHVLPALTRHLPTTLLQSLPHRRNNIPPQDSKAGGARRISDISCCFLLCPRSSLSSAPQANARQPLPALGQSQLVHSAAGEPCYTPKPDHCPPKSSPPNLKTQTASLRPFPDLFYQKFLPKI